MRRPRPLGAELYGEERDVETADAFADVSYAYDGLNRFASQDITVNGVVFRTSVGYAEGADAAGVDVYHGPGTDYEVWREDVGLDTAITIEAQYGDWYYMSKCGSTAAWGAYVHKNSLKAALAAVLTIAYNGNGHTHGTILQMQLSQRGMRIA